MEQNTIFLDSFCQKFFNQSSESTLKINKLRFSTNYKDLLLNLDKFLAGDISNATSISRMGPFLKNDLNTLLNYLVDNKDYTSENPGTLLALLEGLEKFSVEEDDPSVIEIINPFKNFETSFKKFFDNSTTLRVSRYV